MPLDKAILTLGSGANADVALAGVAAEWLVVEREGDSFIATLVASGKRAALPVGVDVTLGGASLTCSLVDRESRHFDAERIADALARVTQVPEALRTVLAEMIAVTGADDGAVILKERGDYSIAAALNSDGESLKAADDLLSDTLVRDALLQTGDVVIGDITTDPRYRATASVTALRLRSVACVPLRVEGRVLGLLYLGRRDVRNPFTQAEIASVHIAAQLVMPWLALLRRSESRMRTSELLALAGESAAMQELRDGIARIAQSPLSVLVTGETGTGKDLVARAIHAQSKRAKGAFVAVNCAAVPEALLASELFGHKRGAFTGAQSDRRGLLESADGGTLFLDEVGDMPAPMQASLLRVLENREVVRVGDHVSHKVDFRLVCATHKDLEAEVVAGRFREDLLFRIREVSVHSPALRSRSSDIALLARTFLRQSAEEHGLAELRFADDALEALARHSWPGNVRELRACIRRAALFAEGTHVHATDLGIVTRANPTSDGVGDLTRSLEEARETFTRQFVEAVLAKHHGDRDAAARALGISVRSLYRYLSTDSSGKDD